MNKEIDFRLPKDYYKYNSINRHKPQRVLFFRSIDNFGLNDKKPRYITFTIDPEFDNRVKIIKMTYNNVRIFETFDGKDFVNGKFTWLIECNDYTEERLLRFKDNHHYVIAHFAGSKCDDIIKIKLDVN